MRIGSNGCAITPASSSSAATCAKASRLREATDVLWTCSSVEIYDLLVVQRGWPLSRFATFVADFMITALLPPE